MNLVPRLRANSGMVCEAMADGGNVQECQNSPGESRHSGNGATWQSPERPRPNGDCSPLITLAAHRPRSAWETSRLPTRLWYHKESPQIFLRRHRRRRPPRIWHHRLFWYVLGNVDINKTGTHAGTIIQSLCETPHAMPPGSHKHKHGESPDQCLHTEAGSRMVGTRTCNVAYKIGYKGRKNLSSLPARTLEALSRSACHRIIWNADVRP